MPTVAALLASLVDLVLPRRCVGCGGPAGPLCSACAPRPALRVSAGVVAYATYDGGLRTALLAYKERGRRDLADPLADMLAAAVRCLLETERAPPGPAVLVPVPSARSAAAARGGDHVRRLGRRVAARTGIRLAPGALSLVRSVQDSAGLRSAERAANVHAAMRAVPAPEGKAALVIDDIVTTGVTLHEARRALGAAGWPVVGAAVIARTPRRNSWSGVRSIGGP